MSTYSDLNENVWRCEDCGEVLIDPCCWSKELGGWCEKCCGHPFSQEPDDV